MYRHSITLVTAISLFSCANSSSIKHPITQSSKSELEIIPIDFVFTKDKQKSFVIIKKNIAPNSAKTLQGFHARKEQWVVSDDTYNFVQTAKVFQTSQFSDYYKITELSPINANTDPSKRIFNLPELLDRLYLEGRLKEDYIDIYPTSETDLLVFIKKPTLISVSFSQNRNIKIVNKSNLVLISPFAEGIEISQTQSSDQTLVPKVQIYSNICVRYHHSKTGILERYSLGEYLNDRLQICDILDNAPANIKIPQSKQIKLNLEPWMPQVHITSTIRNESVLNTVLRWKSLYPLSVIH